MGKRVSYFDRQFLHAEDFQVEQDYHLGRRRGVSAGMFRPGVARGLDVVRVDAGSVRVKAGLAIDRLGREIVLDEDSRAIPVDPAAAVEIWLAYGEAPSDHVSYLGADEQRFTRTDESPAIVPVPPGNVPADGIRLAVVPPGGDPDTSARPLAGPRDSSVTGLSLADDAVTSRALAEADGGASGQDTATGSGIKSGHLQDGAVTADKLAAGVADGLFERIAERLNETGLPIGDGAIARKMLANNAVSSRVLAEAAPGSTDQDANSGTGVKTNHLADQAVTGPKLATGAVSFDKLATKLVFDADVALPGADGADPGVERLLIETVPDGQRPFYLVNVSIVPTTAFPFNELTVRWTHFTQVTQVGSQQYGVQIENFQRRIDVHCVAFRLG
jgi:hypothetical protein